MLLQKVFGPFLFGHRVEGIFIMNPRILTVDWQKLKCTLVNQSDKVPDMLIVYINLISKCDNY